MSLALSVSPCIWSSSGGLVYNYKNIKMLTLCYHACLPMYVYIFNKIRPNYLTK